MKVIKKTPTHPLVLKTGYREFKIVQKKLDKESLYGYTEFPTNTIGIDPNQTIKDYKGTLLHEILHVGYDMFGLGDDDEMPTLGNEFLVTVSSNMIQLLTSLNPELFEFIFSDE
mgnify:CR=1 FL=1